MKKPEMILFDYGQTLINQKKFDAERGTAAVLEHAAKNKYGLSAAQVQKWADAVNKELGRFDPSKSHLLCVEIPNSMFTPYLYESLGIEIPLSVEEIDEIFWNAAAPGAPTDGIADFLEYLKRQKIRSGVISNISFSPSVVAKRINALLPANEFEFILTSSNYIFRKPHKRLFDLALEKAGLDAQSTWYIGDNYECDVMGARQAGIFPVWYIGVADIAPAPQTQPETLTVRSWAELKEKLRE